MPRFVVKKIAKGLSSPTVYIPGCECFPYLTFSTGNCPGGQELNLFKASMPSTIFCKKSTPPKACRARLRIDNAPCCATQFYCVAFPSHAIFSPELSRLRMNFHFRRFSGIITYDATYNGVTELLVRFRYIVRELV